jgi:hypothetical protein
MYGGSGKYNFQLGVQNNVNNAFEITPSTTAGGTTFSTPAMVVDSSGNVGIGSSQLNNAFLTVSKSVNGDVGLSVLNTDTGANANARIDIGASTYGSSELTIQAYSATASGTLLGVTAAKLKAIFDNSSTANTNGLLIGTSGANPLYFSVNGAERARISSTGGFSIGTTADPGAGALYATGNITAYYSDDRLKTRLGNIENALDKVKTLTGFYYEANQTAQDLGYKPVREVGVSAQKVQEILPEVVAPAPIDEQYLTVRYEKLVPLLIEAIKELTDKVEKLEALTKE